MTICFLFAKKITMSLKKNLKEGTVIEALPNTSFKVKMEDGTEILAYLSGKMRLNYIKILPGDKVVMEMSPYDATRGRIIQRK